MNGQNRDWEKIFAVYIFMEKIINKLKTNKNRKHSGLNC